ncbi:MAG: DUF1573 domain-containing protein [Taibaiella sp.]|nr:DUF1573 domain-containing protein [Taibaiella sp.]
MSLLCLAISVAAATGQTKRKNPPPPPPPLQAPQAPQAPGAPPLPQPVPLPVPVPLPLDKNAGIFKFKEETHDYGTVPEGPVAECDFEFKNVGKKPITIANAKGSCGCTVPQWPHEPILPGKSSMIHVTYNTTGRVGKINKTITLTSDAQQQTMTLFIAGEVTPKDANAANAPQAH